MKKSIALIAVAGFAYSASAQDFSLSITAPSTIAEGSVFTIDVIGDASVGTHMLGGGFSLLSTGAMPIDNIVWTPADWSAFNTDGGHTGNGNYDEVIFGQLVIPDIPGFDVPAAGSELGQRIGSFQVTLGPVGFSSVHLTLVASDPFALQVIDINTGETWQNTDGNLVLGEYIFNYPTPSTLALLGFGGLAAGRRRR